MTVLDTLNFVALNPLQNNDPIAIPRRKLTTEETKRLNKLETIADKLKRGENVQNRQLQTWLSHELASRLGL